MVVRERERPSFCLSRNSSSTRRVRGPIGIPMQCSVEVGLESATPSVEIPRKVVGVIQPEVLSVNHIIADRIIGGSFDDPRSFEGLVEREAESNESGFVSIVFPHHGPILRGKVVSDGVLFDRNRCFLS